MPDYRPLRFIAETIEAHFDQPPALEKRPGCPNGFTWRGETFRVVEVLSEWRDYRRRGRMAHNMKPEHLTVAEGRGSWGVGRHYFQVKVEGGRVFEMYYDRAPKDTGHRKGAWFLVQELAEEQ